MRWMLCRPLLLVVLLAVLAGSGLPPASASAPARPLAAGHVMGYGVNAIGAQDAHLSRVQGLGFNWTTGWANWRLLEPSPGDYSRLGDVQIQVDNARARGLRMLVKVRETPDWARPGCGSLTCPPSSTRLSDFGNFMGALATRLAGKGVAYEIFNEVNLSYEWGGQQPNPEYYASILRAIYPKIKAADPGAIVVTAGLATIGTDQFLPGAMNDETFIRRMYNPGGAKGYFDALGSHPYGFAFAPEDNWSNPILSFRRAELHHQLMAEYGDGGTPIWATEFGWLVNPAEEGYSCDWPDRNWQKVSRQQQADYLVRAYQYAYDYWPWMGAMFLFNLDFNTATYYDACDPMRWYAIYGRPAYTALQQMSKPGLMPPTLSVQPTLVTFLVEPKAANPPGRQVDVYNVGPGSFNWTASANQPWITLSPASGSASAESPGVLYVGVNKSGLSAGRYAGMVTIGATGAAQSPQYVQVTLYIGTVYRATLPSVSKNTP